MIFTAPNPIPPENLSLRATLSWEYLFGSCPGGWCCVRTDDGCWIVTDEAAELEHSVAYPDEERFVSWLEATAFDQILDDPVGFLQSFNRVPKIIDERVANTIQERLSV